MLSKSRGLVVRLAAVLHILFSAFDSSAVPEDEVQAAMALGEETPTDGVITIVSEGAVKAAINFILVSCQQTAFCAGRGTFEEELLKFSSGKSACMFMHPTVFRSMYNLHNTR